MLKHNRKRRCGSLIYKRNEMIYMSFTTQWGDFKIAKIIPNTETTWGVYEPISKRISHLVEEVGEEIVDEALQGYPKPLLDVGLRSSRGCIALLGIDEKCSDSKDCLSYKKEYCTLKAKKRDKIPECFAIDDESHLMKNIVSAWLDGYIVLRITN